MWKHYVWLLTLLLIVSNQAEKIMENFLTGNILANPNTIRQKPTGKILEPTPIEKDITPNSENFFAEDTSSSTVGEIKQDEKRYGELSKKKCEEYSQLRKKSYGVEENCQNSIKNKIIGGERAFDGEFPHMARWGVKKRLPTLNCGASLISKQYLLTAAHCCRRAPDGPFTAILGTIDLKTQVMFNISEKIVHPNYSETQQYNDIALLRLSEPVNFSQHIWPACLQTDNDVEQKEAIASGWGGTSRSRANDESNQRFLMKVTLPFYNSSECAMMYTPEILNYTKKGSKALERGLDKKSMICAGEIDSMKSTYFGDSGGPLQIQNKKFLCMYTIIGITSFGLPPFPKVFTKVSNYIPWIESIVWPVK